MRIINSIKVRFSTLKSRIIDLIYYSQTYKNDYIEMQRINKLFSYQFNKNKFIHYDIVLKYLYIQAYFDDVPFERDKIYTLYSKMQIRRNNQNTKFFISKFNNLIESIRLNKYDLSSLIDVDSKNHLLGGNHRIACALYFELAIIPVRFYRWKYTKYFDINWFYKHDFTAAECKYLEVKRKEIAIKHGIYFQIILWPPIKEYFNDIENSISLKCNVLESFTLSVDKNDFRCFLADVYEIDDIDKWKVDKKYIGMKDFKTSMRIINIEIPNPTFRRKANNSDICEEVENIKALYRKKYSAKIKNYFHDIIIHIGDNFEHTKAMKEVILKYEKS